MQLNLFDQEAEAQSSFFARKRKWSTAKHRIILKFIQVFAYKLGTTINYVDGFAGNGRYDEGFGLKDFVEDSKFWNKHSHYFDDTDGSPLIALKCANIFKNEGRLNLRSFFAEASPSINQSLNAHCNDACPNVEYKIYEPLSFELVLPMIMKDLHEHPTVFFLDPFGVKGMTFDNIIQVSNYVSQYKGEVFLLFNNRAVARSAGHLKPTYKNNKDFKSSQTYIKHLTNLLGPDSESTWKEQYLKQKDTPQKFERWALAFFQKQLKKYSSFNGVTSCEIKESYNDRPQYSIVVGSNHPPSAFGEFLNEFFFCEEKLLFNEVNTTGSLSRFLEQQWSKEQATRTNNISHIIKTVLENTKIWTILDDLITEMILKVDQIGYLNRRTYRDFIEEHYIQNLLVAENLGKKGQLTLKSRIKWYN